MSGAPIVVFDQNRWWLTGMYNAAIYPEAQYGEHLISEHTALGLMTNIWVARAFLGLITPK
ncbi:Hypothetical protein RG1141_PA02300 (plasmid) [Neorhizobium galegae bv. officinalis bv. officinalis str. HAMBI 1141]|uniref:Uncharacterized protein n=2 Tax=Neorhizobium galegae TaxID=399 RepID=A0A068THT2_NEOGA|nr:Hypothetical protein RG1141_PA02300 [Neorhizobium galegae bv. officinalis bv. officinalis str. HAMBI 1141]